MASRSYYDLRKLDLVLRRIEPKNYSELNVFSPQHSTVRASVYFNFTSCVQLGPLAARLASEFVIWVRERAITSARGSLIAVRFWMQSLSRAVNSSPTNVSKWTSEHWQLHTTEWWLSVKADPDLADVTKNYYRTHVENFIGHLHVRNVVPRFRVPEGIPMVKHRKKITVAEVRKFDGGDPRDDPIPSDVRSALSELDFLDDLGDSDQVLRRIEILLNATRSFLEGRIRSFWSEWTATRLFLNSNAFDPEDFLERYAVSLDPLKLRRGWRDVIDSRAKIVALLRHMYGSMLPTSASNPLLRLIYNEYQVGEIRDLMHSTPDSVVPFLAIVLLNDPIEVSSISNLQTSSLVTMSDSRNVRVTYLKKRANFRTISVVWSGSDDRALRPTSRRRIEPATALGCILEMRKPLEEYAEPADVHSLFLVCGHRGDGDSVKVLGAQVLLAAWDRLRQEDLILRRYRFTLDKLRPTLILRHFLLTGGDIFATSYMARHKSLNTTQRYLAQLAAEHVSSSAAREVQDAVTLSVTENRQGLRKDAGIPPARARAIMEKAGRMGFLKLSGEKARDKVTEDLVRFTDGEIIVMEDASVAAEFLVFKEHLVSELPTLRTSSNFESAWLALLVFINGCLNAMPADILERGKKLAAELQIAYLDAPHA